jgi:hypothetical protein
MMDIEYQFDHFPIERKKILKFDSWVQGVVMRI